MNKKICPKCGQQSITFLSFISRFNQSKIHCRSCGVLLKGNKTLRMLFYGALIFGFFLGLSVAFLENTYNWGFSSSLLIFLTTLGIVGIPAEIVAWKYGSYFLEEQNINTTSIEM